MQNQNKVSEPVVCRTAAEIRQALLRNDVKLLGSCLAIDPTQWEQPMSWNELVHTTVMWGTKEALATVFDAVDWFRPKAGDKRDFLQRATIVCMDRDWVEKFQMCLQQLGSTHSPHRWALQCHKHRSPNCLRLVLEKVNQDSPLFSSQYVPRLYLERSDQTWSIMVEAFAKHGHIKELVQGFEEMGGIKAWKEMEQDLKIVEKELPPNDYEQLLADLKARGANLLPKPNPPKAG